jgi:formylglycine-generating enzyme required for sulfatase activity
MHSGWLVALAGLALPVAMAYAETAPDTTLQIAYRPQLWVPDGGDAVRQGISFAGVETSGFYMRRPQPGADRAAWRRALDGVRAEGRRADKPGLVSVHYRGVRAWIRLRREIASAIALQPGERVRVDVEARLISGNPEICAAFDYLDPQTGAWRGWSTVQSVAELAQGGPQTVSLHVTVPEQLPAGALANVIIGQDATRNPATAQWELRAITLYVPTTPIRRKALAAALKRIEPPPPVQPIYDRKDLAWASHNFTCYFLFLYDAGVYDRDRKRYRAQELIARWNRDFGGVDSVVLWQAYPRIGVDPRNQLDFYRDMPGGLPGVRALVDELHRHGIKAFIAYNPWDTGTRREAVADTAALARMVRDLNADGIFLDTMTEAPTGLRRAVDAARPGVVFEPEGAPPLDQLGLCSASWAQGFPEYPEPGILLLKWIEPRHMQHQIRRWDRSHAGEIRSAFLNGSGMLIWENIFGVWNPWSEADKAAWRRLSPVLRRFADALRSETWEPMVGNSGPEITVNRWSMDGADLYLFHAPSDPAPTCALLGIPMSAFGGEDALSGAELRSDQAPLSTVNGLGAVVVRRTAHARIPPRPSPRTEPEPLPHSGPVPASQPAHALASPSDLPEGMVLVPGGQVRMHLSHERRECACVPDPGSDPARAAYWAWGDPFWETITHDYAVTLKPFWMDECLVTNGEYERFLKATGYRPAEPRNFLKHWGGKRCPEAIRDHPVVYVDLEDARAYARWAGKRLPTEPEWQLAAQGTDGRKWPWGAEFDASRCSASGGTTPGRAHPRGRSPFGCYDMAGNVWQWTESEHSDGHTRACIIRGGSWFDAPGSLWYVHGGPQPLDTHTRFLLMHPGLDRCATIGFRCARDAGS